MPFFFLSFLPNAYVEKVNGPKMGEKKVQSEGAGGVRVCRGPVCRREIGGHLPPQLIKTGGGRDGSELSLSLCQREGEKKTQARKKAKRRRSRWRKSSRRNAETAPVSPRKTPKGLREGKILVLLGGLHHPCFALRIFVLDLKVFCSGWSWLLFASCLPVMIRLRKRVRNSTVPAYTLI